MRSFGQRKGDLNGRVRRVSVVKCRCHRVFCDVVGDGGAARGNLTGGPLGAMSDLAVITQLSHPHSSTSHVNLHLLASLRAKISVSVARNLAIRGLERKPKL